MRRYGWLVEEGILVPRINARLSSNRNSLQGVPIFGTLVSSVRKCSESQSDLEYREGCERKTLVYDGDVISWTNGSGACASESARAWSLGP
jgi:hypothetical protein